MSQRDIDVCCTINQTYNVTRVTLLHCATNIHCHVPLASFTFVFSNTRLGLWKGPSRRLACTGSRPVVYRWCWPTMSHNSFRPSNSKWWWWGRWNHSPTLYVWSEDGSQ